MFLILATFVVFGYAFAVLENRGNGTVNGHLRKFFVWCIITSINNIKSQTELQFD
jgi:hypothetical protein